MMTLAGYVTSGCGREKKPYANLIHKSMDDQVVIFDDVDELDQSDGDQFYGGWVRLLVIDANWVQVESVLREKCFS